MAYDRPTSWGYLFIWAAGLCCCQGREVVMNPVQLCELIVMFSMSTIITVFLPKLYMRLWVLLICFFSQDPTNNYGHSTTTYKWQRSQSDESLWAIRKCDTGSPTEGSRGMPMPAWVLALTMTTRPTCQNSKLLHTFVYSVVLRLLCGMVWFLCCFCYPISSISKK